MKRKQILAAFTEDLLAKVEGLTKGLRHLGNRDHQPKDGSTDNGLAPPPSITKEMTYKLAYSLTLWR